MYSLARKVNNKEVTENNVAAYRVSDVRQLKIRTDAEQSIGPAADMMCVFASVNGTPMRKRRRKKNVWFVHWHSVTIGFVQAAKGQSSFTARAVFHANTCTPKIDVFEILYCHLLVQSHCPNTTIGTQWTTSVNDRMRARISGKDEYMYARMDRTQNAIQQTNEEIDREREGGREGDASK